MIRILYFAGLRETLGSAEEQLMLSPEVVSVAALVAMLRCRGGVWAQALGPDTPLMVAVNQTLARPATVIRDGDEVALFPPVTGG